MDEELKSVVLEAPKKAAESMEELRVADAISEIFTLFKRCNKYIDETMPWALAKEEDKKERLATVLYNLVESISIGASLLVCLYAGDLGARSWPSSTARREAWIRMDTFGLYENGTKVTDKPEILFARLDHQGRAGKSRGA